MEVTQDHAALLPAGDLDKLDKREREEFHTLQEKMVAMMLAESNHFQLRYPGLKIEWKFQMEVYQTVQSNPSTVRYSSRVY